MKRVTSILAVVFISFLFSQTPAIAQNYKFDQSKVDEANRRVLDWVLYGKR